MEAIIDYAEKERDAAYKFIRRQFSQGNAWKVGIATKYITRKGPSFDTFKAAVAAVGGEIWREIDYQIHENITRHEYTCEAYIPDWRHPEADIYYDRPL